MTVAELRAECDSRGVSYRMVEDLIQVLDATQLPGALQEHLRQDGFLRGHGPETLAAAEPEPPARGAAKK